MSLGRPFFFKKKKKRKKQKHKGFAYNRKERNRDANAFVENIWNFSM